VYLPKREKRNTLPGGESVSIRRQGWWLSASQFPFGRSNFNPTE